MRLQNQRFPVSKHKRIPELKIFFEMSHNILLGSVYGENQSVSGLFLNFLKGVKFFLQNCTEKSGGGTIDN